MKRIVMGIFAHVDAGKTTLSEALLYSSGVIRKMGRVDHKDAYLDTYDLERKRGITIFSKQAELNIQDTHITLIDTPGHVDFSAEAERTLSILDYAILIISASDGIQAHTRTLWNLLLKYNIPVFIFINKADMPGIAKENILNQLKKEFSDNCIDIESPNAQEQIALCNEKILEKNLRGEIISDDDLTELINTRQMFICRFGSALKLIGIDALLNDIIKYTTPKKYSDIFGANVYKISRDPSGKRITHMKITGGILLPKDIITYNSNNNEFKEKVDTIRIYSGDKFSPIDRADAGTVCSITGLTHTYAGQILGSCDNFISPVTEPVIIYNILPSEDYDIRVLYQNMTQLQEEYPELNIIWDSNSQELHVKLMGEIQKEILKHIIKERFNTSIELGKPNIVYKETIAHKVEGIGHFEPLRHYSEVHLLLEPLKNGSGIQFENHCSTDVLNTNWQKLIMSNLKEKDHVGVLTGSPITDIKISLISGKAHPKHTDGGDFRQAACRAVRQGLMKAESVLLEPYYNFRLEVPQQQIGKAMTDMEIRHAIANAPVTDGTTAIITGKVPVANIINYSIELSAYTKGTGKIYLSIGSYLPCNNSDEIINDKNYNPESDIENTPDSVFCYEGSGHIVKWDKVEQYMHIPLMEKQKNTVYNNTEKNSLDDDLNAMSMFNMVYNKTKKNDSYIPKKHIDYSKFKSTSNQITDTASQYLLIDGYNIIHSWKFLNNLANKSMQLARDQLISIISKYQSYKKNNVIIVFDAYMVNGGKGEIDNINGVHVVYTKESQTADDYIEKVTSIIGKKFLTRVATADCNVQLISFGNGALRMTSTELKNEIESTDKEIKSIIENLKTGTCTIKDSTKTKL